MKISSKTPDGEPSSFAQLRTSDRPLTARAVADLCGVELKTVHNWVVEGRLEHFRTPGRHLRFQPRAVLRFLEQCGYERRSSPAPRIALLVTSSRAKYWNACLSGYQIARAVDMFSALVVAGQSNPHIIVVDTTSASPALLRNFARACQRELQQVTLVFVTTTLRKTQNSGSRGNDDTLAHVQWATPRTLGQVAIST